MKTSFALILTMTMLICCNSTTSKETTFTHMYNVREYSKVIQGMHYVVFVSEGIDNAGTATVINVTKDKLECDYYRKQLKSLDNL
jgi:uncharacterized protein YcfL